METMEQGSTDSWAIYCDDCGQEKMAEIRNGKLVITDRRHGTRHIAVVPFEDRATREVKKED